MRCQIATPWQPDANAPQLDADHPLPSGASWMDRSGQQTYQLPPLPNACIVEVWHVTQDWLDAVAADANYLVLWTAEDDAEPSGTLTSEQLAAIRSYFADVSEAQVDHYVGTEPDGRSVAEVAESVREWSSLFMRQDEMPPEDYVRLVNRYPAYEVGRLYAAGELFAYNDALYEAVQPHESAAEWPPDQNPALYTEVAPGGVVPVWSQPSGQQDAYDLDALVTWPAGGRVWKSLKAANTDEPGEVGTWRDQSEPPLWVQPSGSIGLWQVGDVVEHDGQVWRNTSPNNSFAPGVYGWVVVNP